MKKFIAILLVVATMLLCLTACGGKKATAVVTFENVDSVVALPGQNMKNIGVEVLNNSIMTVNMGKEGVFTFPVVVDGNIYEFNLTNENGIVSVPAIEGLTFTVK